MLAKKVQMAAPVGLRLMSEYVPFDSNPRVSVLTEIHDTPGALHELLKWFWKHDINVTHIESRPTPKGSDTFHMYIDFEGQIGDGASTDALMVGPPLLSYSPYDCRGRIVHGHKAASLTLIFPPFCPPTCHE